MKNPDSPYEWLARLGYAARGLVYLILGGLALFSGGWGGADDSEGALSTLLGQPFGRVLLGVVALGLFSFAGWRLAQGVFNADHRDKNWKNGLVRAGKVIGAGASLSLGVFAAGLALGLAGGTSGDNSEEGWAAMLMGLPFGRYLVGALGLVVIGAGIAQVWKAVSRSYCDWLDIPPTLRKLLVPLCSYGIGARGVVFAILGGFLVYAALTVEPDQAGSIGDALDWVRSLPFGGVLLIAVALGLIAFAASCVVFALYRRVDVPDADEMGAKARSAAQAARGAVR